MSSEGSHEDGKLSAAKSWFTRSASSRTLQKASVEAAPDEVSSGNSVSKEGAVVNISGFTSLRQQLSMRRLMVSGEIKIEAGPGSPSMTVKNVTPLTPLTPLKWKSNPREQEEEEKASERSRLGSAIPAGPICEGFPDGKPAAEGGKEDRSADGQQHGSTVAEHGRTNPADVISTEVRPGNIGEDVNLESLEGPDRKTTSGDDVMTMTIEFLRARLLSERSASKTAKLEIQQLAKKVSELEEKLNQALQDQKKAEDTAQEAFMKLKLAESSNHGTNSTVGEVPDRLISTSTIVSPLSRSRAGLEDTKYLQQDTSSNKDLSRTNSYGSSVEDRDSSTKGSSSETGNKSDERTAEQSRPGVRPAPLDMTERSQVLPQNQESRAVIESRLRNMWSKISEDMAALAEERREDVVRKELISWMGQVPACLQNMMPELVSRAHDVELRSESERISLHGVPRQRVDNQSELFPETVQVKDQFHTEAKRAALLHEQVTAQENVQIDWERNYQGSQREVEKLKGDTLHGSASPISSMELQHADNGNGRNGLVDNSEFLRPHHATLAKSSSSLDVSTRSNGYNLDVNSPHRDDPYGELDPWNRERSLRQGADDRHHNPTYQNTPAHWRMALDHTGTDSKHGRIHQDPSSAPSILAEDGENSKPDYRSGEPSWDDRDRGYSGRHQQARPRNGDAHGVMERDSYYRQRVMEARESYSPSQPEITHRHRHRRSHSDDYDEPSLEDYGLLYQQPEFSPGPGRRQSYSGYPAAMAADPRRTSFDKPIGSYDDLRYVDERMYRANEQRRNSFPATKVDDAPRQLNSTQVSRNGDPIAEPTLSLGYGPAYDAPPREDSPVQQSPKSGLNRNISDVLRALQLAKAKIQNGGAGSMGHRLSREQISPSFKPDYAMEPSGQYMQ
ncbi:hypothetical protein KC19_1G019400 [Ceratodon purpureus]|uniref:Uncharacterized protein n=1 Tax=Ceratodon purpureus TaxID=3225 RepID=A0A8T0J0C0_CERPU|nr:hypothetical protein KC19_1G019400 [Ceratodon purpureus]